MRIIDRLTNVNGVLLVIYETKNGNLIGELYHGGKRVAGKWDSRATFRWEDGDAEPYRVREYFGF